MRIGLRVAVAGKVLAAALHARQQQAVQQAFGQLGRRLRLRVQGAVANHGAAAPVQIKHRGERKINAAGAQLGGEHVAAGSGGGQRLQGVFLPQAAQGAHGRQRREAPFAKALHAAAFVVDGNERIRPDGADGRRQRRNLLAALPVAREQNDAARQRMGDAAAIVRREGGACDVDDERSVGHEPCG